MLKVAHDEDYEIYVNGQLLFAEPGYNSSYRYIKMDEDKSELFQKGQNVIAVHCKNTNGDQLIDVDIGEIAPVKADQSFS